MTVARTWAKNMGRGLRAAISELYYGLDMNNNVDIRDFHVVSKLHVRRELESLVHGDVTPRLKHHHSNRLAREGISYDEFRDNAVQECNEN